MKQTRLFCLGLTMASCLSAFAATDEPQNDTDKYAVVTNRFNANWFIGVNGGAQMYISDGFKLDDNKWKLVTPAVEINAGKWFTPGIGLRLGVAGYQAKGFSWSPNVGHVYKEIKPGVYGTKWGMIQTHADAMLNFTNLFLGYKENRVYNAIPYASISYLRGVDQSKENELGVGLGFINSFRVNNALNINLELRATAVNDHMDGIVGGKNYEATTAVLVGVSYKLGKKGWNRPNQVSGEEIAAVQSRLKEMHQENQLLRNQIGELQQDLANATQSNGVLPVAACPANLANYVVFFNINKADVSQKEEINLKEIADKIKQYPAAKFRVTGYADEQTGTAAYNEALSKQRAEAVYNVLVNKYNVNPNQLILSYKGGVADLFDGQPRLSRATIVSVSE